MHLIRLLLECLKLRQLSVDMTSIAWMYAKAKTDRYGCLGSAITQHSMWRTLKPNRLLLTDCFELLVSCVNLLYVLELFTAEELSHQNQMHMRANQVMDKHQFKCPFLAINQLINITYWYWIAVSLRSLLQWMKVSYITS
jgi:hypothetical protein